MKLRTILAGLAVAAIGAATSTAAADTPPVSGGTEVGGTVNSMIELVLTQPATATFTTFSKPKTYTTSFNAFATMTDAPTQLTLADGDVASGSKLGHLASGSKALPLPLEAAAGKLAFQPLDTTVDPQLAKWTDVGTRQPAIVKLRQKVSRKAAGTYRKVLLVTLSSETP
jgi:hypothetical protein